MLKNLILWSSFLFLPACLSTIDSTKLQIPSPVADDEAYNKAYGDATVRYDVVHHFETKYKISITYLNDNFRQALATRHENIFHEPQPVLTEASQKTGFFVSIYSQDRALSDLSDPRLWTVQLKVGNSILKPATIKTLSPKERWAAFFPEISLWSNEYVILFDQAPPSNQPDSTSFSMELVLSSPTGSISSRW